MIFTETAGKIITPDRYNAHWLIMTRNGQRIPMFVNGLKIFSFAHYVKMNLDLIAWAIWTPLNESIPTIGVIRYKDSNCFDFIIQDKILRPININYDSTTRHNISLFIRNKMKVSGRKGGYKPSSVSYRAAISCGSEERSIFYEDKNNELQMEGFLQYHIVGVTEKLG